MTSEQIHDLSNLIAGQLNGPPWWSYLVMLAFGAAGGFLGAYFKKKGENYATHEDFRQVLEQQKLSTEAVEDIKQVLLSRSWVKQRQWEARERHFSKILRELAALEVAAGFLFVVVKRFSHQPKGIQELNDVAKVRWEHENNNMDMHMNVLAEAIGEAEMHLPMEVVQSVRTLIKNEHELVVGSNGLKLSQAAAWIEELGAARQAILAVARDEVRRIDSPV